MQVVLHRHNYKGIIYWFLVIDFLLKMLVVPLFTIIHLVVSMVPNVLLLLIFAGPSHHSSSLVVLSVLDSYLPSSAKNSLSSGYLMPIFLQQNRGSWFRIIHHHVIKKGLFLVNTAIPWKLSGNRWSFRVVLCSDTCHNTNMLIKSAHEVFFDDAKRNKAFGCVHGHVARVYGLP